MEGSHIKVNPQRMGFWVMESHSALCDALCCSPQDVAALESQPLLGFFLREEKYGPAQRQQFKLYHKNTLFYIFKADDIPSAQRSVSPNDQGRTSSSMFDSPQFVFFNNDNIVLLEPMSRPSRNTSLPLTPSPAQKLNQPSDVLAAHECYLLSFIFHVVLTDSW
jgi:hypothetical protein